MRAVEETDPDLAFSEREKSNLQQTRGQSNFALLGVVFVDTRNGAALPLSCLFRQIVRDLTSGATFAGVAPFR